MAYLESMGEHKVLPVGSQNLGLTLSSQVSRVGNLPGVAPSGLPMLSVWSGYSSRSGLNELWEPEAHSQLEYGGKAPGTGKCYCSRQ